MTGLRGFEAVENFQGRNDEEGPYLHGSNIKECEPLTMPALHAVLTQRHRVVIQSRLIDSRHYTYPCKFPTSDDTIPLSNILTSSLDPFYLLTLLARAMTVAATGFLLELAQLVKIAPNFSWMYLLFGKSQSHTSDHPP